VVYRDATHDWFDVGDGDGVAPDGRIFVCQQGGTLRVIKNRALLAQPFLTVTVNASGERGLLGVAVDPNFSTNQFVYIYYTATTPAVHNRVSRFTATEMSRRREAKFWNSTT
jgi:glucose/arabinose dehydrogenase